MSTGSPKANDPKAHQAAVVLSYRLKRCWSKDLDWDVIPVALKEGCHQVGRAISLPPVAVLAGLLLTVSFCMSHSAVQVEATEWVEPVLLWISICMPTGSGKSALCKFLKSLVDKTKAISTELDAYEVEPAWCLDDQSFEKMGSLMSENHGKLLGLYDELAMFLSQMNVFRGRGISESHELALFLQLYGASSWVRRTVSGDANFKMNHTGMTLGGFIQPSVARSLIELQPNVEKGMCQRFLWVVPQPTLVQFQQLQPVNDSFVNKIVKLMSTIWVPSSNVRIWILPRTPVESDDEVEEMACGHFQTMFNRVQQMLQKVGCMDDLLSGMLSKSKGQILRVAAVMHVLFHMDTPTTIPQKISEDAVKAADSFVSVCLQHAAYLGGRGNIEEDIDEIQQAVATVRPPISQDHSVASFCLLLPGKVLNLSALLAAKRFRDRGNKDGAVRAMKLLQDAGLGTVVETRPPRGTNLTYEFIKNDVPEGDERMEFISKLLTFGVSIKQFQGALEQDEIKVNSESKKRTVTESGLSTPTRKSPRKKLLGSSND